MYISSRYDITNTPNIVKAGYNTWPYTAPRNDWYQHVPTYYTDQFGNVKTWNQWDPLPMMNLPNGMYKGTPTRTGAFYAQNVVPR
jgi:hypothetical protein